MLTHKSPLCNSDSTSDKRDGRLDNLGSQSNPVDLCEGVKNSISVQRLALCYSDFSLVEGSGEVLSINGPLAKITVEVV